MEIKVSVVEVVGVIGAQQAKPVPGKMRLGIQNEILDGES